MLMVLSPLEAVPPSVGRLELADVVPLAVRLAAVPDSE
jgi:hypothetical protein